MTITPPRPGVEIQSWEWPDIEEAARAEQRRRDPGGDAEATIKRDLEETLRVYFLRHHPRRVA